MTDRLTIEKTHTANEEELRAVIDAVTDNDYADTYELATHIINAIRPYLRSPETTRREQRLTHALRMLADDTLSPKQRRRIIDEVLSHYQSEDSHAG